MLSKHGNMRIFKHFIVSANHRGGLVLGQPPGKGIVKNRSLIEALRGAVWTREVKDYFLSRYRVLVTWISLIGLFKTRMNKRHAIPNCFLSRFYCIIFSWTCAYLRCLSEVLMVWNCRACETKNERVRIFTPSLFLKTLSDPQMCPSSVGVCQKNCCLLNRYALYFSDFMPAIKVLTQKVVVFVRPMELWKRRVKDELNGNFEPSEQQNLTKTTNLSKCIMYHY